MTANFSLENTTNLLQQAYQSLLQGDYYKAASLYEQAITAEPEIKSHYWYLGLVLLLQGQAEEAQTTWLMVIMEGDPEQVDEWNIELIQVLQTEAQRREEIEDNSTAWVIRQQIRELQPTGLENILPLLYLAIDLETLTGDELDDWGVIELLKAEPSLEVDAEWLLQLLDDVIDNAPLHPATVEFAEACLPYIKNLPHVLNVLLFSAIKIVAGTQEYKQAAKFAELCLQINDSHPELLRHLASFYQNTANCDKGIEMAQRCYEICQTTADKAFANHLILRGLMYTGGRWEESCLVMQQQKSLLEALFAQKPTQLYSAEVMRLYCCTYFFPYFQDKPQENRQLINQIAEICQTNVNIYAQENVEKYRQRSQAPLIKDSSPKPLKIGYVSQSLRRHSVGWLARWLIQHHNREEFQIYGYFVGAKSYQVGGSNQSTDTLREWYFDNVDKANKLGVDTIEIAEQIYADEIDILVDLDSLTLDTTCEVIAFKSAPIQVSWLAWDASGIPTIDYFIADPYVLPESAQDYYTEKIWRLPQTYIAIDGFEVGVPTLRRSDIDIPADAVVYLSAQSGYKRHPDTARLQMQIIKAVPNSYFLIKGSSEQESTQNFFKQIAEEEGVAVERLRFLPNVPAESIHRANLAIADVVLDTYPYNGATTTLETLWMCVPLVTRVGEQFAARNSYTMMMNAGITEGIAWTDEEYLEWGIRLGKDEALRQQISWKLRQSRQTAPLWNAKQFTCEMEKAYQQMWQRWQRIM
ncbi:MAG: O-linked N-acetylglucosamine transferase, SPINDLY family protein [Nostocaceae cyanobacterium]|nr:O-linked N-acetylglucosamine transferase, SPINDLY family protein [Nostocaceae cyanobacterium]